MRNSSHSPTRLPTRSAQGLNVYVEDLALQRGELGVEGLHEVAGA